GKTITWEAKSCNPRGHEGSATGVSFHGTEGTLIIDGNGYTLYDMDNNVVQDSESDPADAVDRTGPGQSLDQGHQNNFFDAIQDGITPNSVIQDVNTSVHLCHLGNVAHRVGHTIHCDSHDGTIIGDREAMSYWKRTYEPGWEPTL
ncbi:MAG: gfo/Idh/MocA family oxidoreductase, partial [Bacteroidota bacterium]